MKGALILLLCAYLSLSTCHQINQTDVDKFISFESIIRNLLIGNYETTKMAQEDDMFRIMVFGDFGYLLNYFGIGRATTTMNELAKQKHYEYMITVGDNFYPNGIPYMWFRFIPWASMSQFKKSAIKDTLIYPVLGNHDCFGSVENSIKFSNYDSQWTLDEEYYVMTEPMKDDPSKYFVNLMLNSCKLVCISDEFSYWNHKCDLMHVEPGNEEVLTHYKWLEDQLEIYSNDPNAAWIAVTLHHPPFVETSEKKYLLPILQKYNVDIMFVGHDHWIEYANMKPDYEIRFPTARRGPILDNCKNKTEILNTGDRVQIFKRGDRLHQFLVGNGGATLDDICPYRDQDGDVFWRNTEGFGVMTAEMNSKQFTATYYVEGQKEVYKVIIEQ